MEHLTECHTTLERVVAQRAKEKCTKDSDLNPSVVTRNVLVDAAIGVGESGTKKPSVGLNKSAGKAIHLRTRCKRDIREWSNTSEKGQGHSQPKGKGKGKGKGKRKHPGKGSHNQDQAGSPNEDGQRTLGDFGLKRQRVEFVGDVQENDDFESHRLERAAYVFRVQKCNSVAMDSTELPSSSTRVFSGIQGSEEPAGTHEKPDQSSGEVLTNCRLWKCCVHVPSGLCDVGSDRESAIQYEFGECVG